MPPKKQEDDIEAKERRKLANRERMRKKRALEQEKNESTKQRKLAE